MGINSFPSSGDAIIQSDGGWYGASFSEVGFNDTYDYYTLDVGGGVTLGCSDYGNGSYCTVYGNNGYGQRYLAAAVETMYYITSVQVYIYKYGSPGYNLRMVVYDETAGAALDTVTFYPTEGWNIINTNATIYPTSGHIIQIRIDSQGYGTSSNHWRMKYNGASYVGNAHYITTGDLWTNRGDYASYDLVMYVNVYYKTLSGQVVVTAKPNGIYKWQKLFYTEYTPTNTSVACTVQTLAGTTLISDAPSGTDLSAYDIINYPGLKFVFTLSRPTAATTSPRIYVPSWTYIGAQSSDKNLINAGSMVKKYGGLSLYSSTSFKYYDSVTAHSISGAGLITGIGIQASSYTTGYIHVNIQVIIDGSTRISGNILNGDGYGGDYASCEATPSITIPMMHRFNSSFQVIYTSGGTSSNYNMNTFHSVASYVLD